MIQEIINKKISHFKQRFIIGVSGGVDSMVLLNIVHQLHPDLLIVCHVNYNLRSTSSKEALMVKRFCLQRKIPYHILNVKRSLTTNIQEQARLMRMNFFKKIAAKYKIKNILLGHNFEDHLETYYLQKQRNIITPFWGIKAVALRQNLTIIRPMLTIFKKQIYNYATSYNIPFLEDETNFKNIYERNKIRWKKISNLSNLQKKLLGFKISLKNLKNKQLFKKVAIMRKEIITKNKFHKSLFKHKYKHIFIVLYYFLKDLSYPIKRINKKIINEIISFHHKSINNKVKLTMCQNFFLQKDGEWYVLLKGKINESKTKS